MALTFFSGFETGDFGEWTSVDNSPAIATTGEVDGDDPNTGSYCMCCNTSSSYEFISLDDTGHTDDYICASFYLYIATAPGSDCDILRLYPYYGGAYDYLIPSFYLTSARKIKIGSDTGSTALSLNTWYRICIETWFTSGVSAYANCWINGNSELSNVNTDNVSQIDSSALKVGVMSSVTTELYFDDVAYTRSASSIGDLGDIRVLRAGVTGAGEYNTFDTISGYENCDEVPAIDADYVDDSGVEAFHAECYNLQDATTIGVGASDTWKAVNVLARIYTVNSGGGIVVRDNSVDYKTAKDVGKAYTWANVIYDTNAPRASAWTSAIFDAFQSGGYNEGKSDMYMSCVMVMVAYIPAAGGIDYPISTSCIIDLSPTIAYKADWDRATSPNLSLASTIDRDVTYTRAITGSNLSLAVNLAKVFGRVIISSAGLTLAPTVSRAVTWTKATSSNLSLSPTIIKSWGRAVATSCNLSLAPAIAMSKGFNRAISNALSLATIVTRALTFGRASSSNLSATTNIIRKLDVDRATSTGITLAPTISKSWGRIKALTANLTVAVNLAKSLNRTITSSVALNLTTNIDRVATYTRATTQNLSLAVNIAKSRARTIVTSSALSLATTITRALTYTRTSSTSLTLTTNVVKSWGRTISTSAGITLVASINRVVTYARATSSNINTAVSVVVTYVAGAVTHYLITLSTNLSLATSVDRAVAWSRATPSALSLTVNVIKQRARTIATSTGLTLTTTISKATAYTRAVSANLSLATSISRAVTYTKALTTNLSLATTIVKSWGRSIATSSALALTTTVSRVVAYTRVSSVALTLTTNVSRALTYTRATSTNLALTANIVKGWGRTITTSSALSLTALVTMVYEAAVRLRSIQTPGDFRGLVASTLRSLATGATLRNWTNSLGKRSETSYNPTRKIRPRS